MGFEKKYKNIKSVVQEDLNLIEQEIKILFKGKNPLDKDIADFLIAPSKRLRPLLGVLFLKCVFDEINLEQRNVLIAVELIHNATLIHDDVIDKAEKRRNQETFNVKFDDNLAVIAGDFLLSVAMEKVINAKSIEVLQIFASALKSTCIGEINQYFSKFGITSIDEYIEKSKDKTALLFQIGLLGGVMLNKKDIYTDLQSTHDPKVMPNSFQHRMSERSCDTRNEPGAGSEINSGQLNSHRLIATQDDEILVLKQIAVDFAQNFGIAFQIRDDLINILNSDKLANNDVSLGIYTAPIIFAYQENKDILKEKNIIELIKNTKGIEKTKNLMDNYFNKAILAIKDLNDNIYKKALVEIIDLLRENL